MTKNVLIIGGLALTAAITLPAALVYYNFNRQVEFSSPITTTAKEAVPLPQEEDVISLFFELINEKRIPEAISMLSPQAIGDESQKQAWGVQFNAFSNVLVKSVDREEKGLYRVVLGAEMKPSAADAIIPFYGYTNGENTRWISLDKVDESYKISGIATGK